MSLRHLLWSRPCFNRAAFRETSSKAANDEPKLSRRVCQTQRALFFSIIDRVLWDRVGQGRHRVWSAEHRASATRRKKTVLSVRQGQRPRQEITLFSPELSRLTVHSLSLRVTIGRHRMATRARKRQWTLLGGEPAASSRWTREPARGKGEKEREREREREYVCIAREQSHEEVTA